jgi:hypothetical protein
MKTATFVNYDSRTVVSGGFEKCFVFSKTAVRNFPSNLSKFEPFLTVIDSLP